MAFTRDELTRGAWYAWLTFMALMTGGVLVVLSASHALRPESGPLSGLWFTLLTALIGCALIGGTVSLIAMVLGTLIALPIGHALRRISHPALHLLSYCLLSAAMAALGALVTVPILEGLGNLGVAIVVAVVLAAIPAAPVGWWLTSRRALRDDAWRAHSGTITAHE